MSKISNETFLKQYDRVNHVMIDIETLSTEANTVIPQIAMVRFNPFTGKTFKHVSISIDIEPQMQKGQHISKSTMLWWLNQSKDAVQNVFNCDCVHPEEALNAIEQFIHKDDIIWGNGPSFDCAKIAMFHHIWGKQVPWKYWNERCVRTIGSFCPENKKNEPFEGIAHDGLDDCLHQIKYLNKTIVQLAKAFE